LEKDRVIIFRSDLMKATGLTKAAFRKRVRLGKMPKPDIPPRNGRNGSEPGWFVDSLPLDLKKSIERQKGFGEYLPRRSNPILIILL